ncbi:MAG: DNA repair protein RecN [Alphaproteobacteria bacterium]
MLSQLSIRNIVLIERCELSLAPGLCVLSGETGAGKSILLDALGLVLGARADSTLLRKGEEQGSVTASFDLENNLQARAILDELGLETSGDVIIRRMLTADGKTRAFINDQPVTVAALRQLGEVLVEIHGQHDQRTLMDAALHRLMLDDYAGLQPALKKVAAAYGVWQSKRTELNTLNEKLAAALREQDYLSHMRHELKKLAPQKGEEEELTDARTTMMQSEKLFEVLGEVMNELQGEKGAVQSLRSAQRLLSRSPLTSGGKFSEIIDGLEKAAIEADEAMATLEQLADSSQYDAGKLEQMEERLFALKAAARKYHVSVDDLPGLLAEVEEKLALTDAQDTRRDALEKEVKVAKEAFANEGQVLSNARKQAAVKLEKAVMKELQPLKMAGTHFHIRIEPQGDEHWAAHGMDAVAFVCATNIGKGETPTAFSPLSKIASGGELSRFMLALKVSLSKGRQSGTLIFDEIDTGTGGAVAAAIGERLRKLGEGAQVLVVTHLPQVAAQGSQHLLVEKSGKSKITTQVTELDNAQRAEELARMLAGSTITAEARKAAAKLLEDAA